MKPKILHVISGLEEGGAEAMLWRIIRSTPQYEHVVVSLRGFGKYGNPMRNIGVEVVDLDLRLGLSLAWSCLRFVMLIRRSRPQAIQTWMYHGNLFGGVFGRIFSSAPVVWSLHHASFDRRLNKRSTLLIARLCGKLSSVIPRSIVCVSQFSLEQHVRIGYRSDKMLLIPNGVDTSVFSRSVEARAKLRGEWGIGPSETVIGMVARFDPLKDHRTLLRAIQLVLDCGLTVRVILVGSGLSSNNSSLRAIIEEFGIGDQIILLGSRSDVPDIMSAIDIHVLSSINEAAPTVVLEALACGAVCVCTDVGDCKKIIDNAHLVVEPRNSRQLAEAIRYAIEDFDRGELLNYTIPKVQTTYSLSAMAAGYSEAWDVR